MRIADSDQRCSEFTFNEAMRIGLIYCASIMQVADTMCFESETDVFGAVGKASAVDTSFDLPTRENIRRYSILGVEFVDLSAEGFLAGIHPGPTDVELAKIRSIGRESLSGMSRLKPCDLGLSLAVYLSPCGDLSEWVIRLVMSARVVGPEPGRIEVRCDSAERVRADAVKVEYSAESQ